MCFEAYLITQCNLIREPEEFLFPIASVKKDLHTDPLQGIFLNGRKVVLYGISLHIIKTVTQG